MATTSNFGITLLEQSQAQKETTINEAFALTDVMLKGTVIDKDMATRPISPVAGASYIVAASPTGVWSGKENSIAYFDQIWRFVAPKTGMRLWVSDELLNYEYNGTAWVVSNPAVHSIRGNAATATALQTPRTINGIAFDGTANISITAAAGAATLTGTTLAAGVTGSSLTSVGTIVSGVWNGTPIAVSNGGTGGTTSTGTGAVVLATSPILVGTPVAPTAAAGTDTIQLATTAFALANNFTLGTSAASTSGTSIDFTLIPATAKYIVVNFAGVSTNGASNLLLQLGDSSGVETAGYNSGATLFQNAVPYAIASRYSAGFGLACGHASNLLNGAWTLTLLDATTHLWCCTSSFSSQAFDVFFIGAGSKSLSAVLDRVRITTVGGTDTFDAGTINVSWG